MTATFDVRRSDLTLVMSAASGSAQISGSVDDLEPILSDPLPIAVEDEGHLLFASVRDQMTLEIQPPKVILRHSVGGWPGDSTFEPAIPGLLEFMDRFSLDVPVFGWNLEGALTHASAETVLRLLQVQQVSNLLGGISAPTWMPKRLHLVSRDILEREGVLTISLESDSEHSDGSDVQLSMNAHFDRTSGPTDALSLLDSGDVQTTGRDFLAKAEEIVGRLVDLRGE